jgi:hypothetical protein
VWTGEVWVRELSVTVCQRLLLGPLKHTNLQRVPFAVLYLLVDRIDNGCPTV